MPHAVLLGGTGQIGRAAAQHLLDHGWTVTLACRGLSPSPDELIERGAILARLDRGRSGTLAGALGAGADLLVDAVAYGPEHASQLLEVQKDVGALVVISSASVYRDEAGRTLDEASAQGFPVLPEPVQEDQPTVEPGPETYSTRKVALERVLLDGATIPVTVLRPAAIHGPGSSHPREWWIVKRMLDRRPVIPLAYGGRSRFHTTAAANIASAVRAVAGVRGRRVLNIADPSAIRVDEIMRLVGRHLSYAGRVLALDDDGLYPPNLGRTPWSVQHPFVLDTSALQALGYRASTDYAGAVASTCDWLTSVATASNWRALFPVLASYPYDLFDYAAEDVGLQRRSAS